VRLKRLLSFEAMAFFIINEEDQDFVLTDYEPTSDREKIEREARRLIEDGSFAWSLYQARAVMVPSQEYDQRILLHSLSSKSRMRGMFLGVLDRDESTIFDSSLSLLSIVFLNSANALESFEYFNMVREQNLTLEATVKERTNDLEIARDHAERANRAKSEFLSNMSHELRSPLNAIVDFSDVLLLNSKNAEILDFASKINDAGKYLTRLIEDLLDIDRIEAGKIRLDLQTVSINDIVASMVEMRLHQLPKNFSLNCSLDPECGVAICDPVRINQIIVNLLDNAVKYSPEGGTIRVRTEARPGETWTSVQDEGIGIGPEMQELIFDRFQQVEEGLRRETGGLGIGLSLVKQLLTLHNGRIWVESEIGKGSTFTFALPLAIDESGQSAEGETLIHPPSGEADVPWARLKVLVVDDLEDYHQLMKILLRDAGQIDTAYNGSEAIEAIGRELPDLIIMDLRMPVMDGFEAIRRIKGDPKSESIPILGVSAQAMEEDKEKCLVAGANGFVTKPVEFNTLLKEIGKILP
jgi:signal transduction histidine kinase